MGGTTLLSSLDMERLARHGLLEYGEFEVELSRNAIKNDPHGQTGVQLKNPLNEDLIQISIMRRWRGLQKFRNINIRGKI